MHSDIVDLREFYQSPAGRVVKRVLQKKLRVLWPNLRGESVLALGYTAPLLRPVLNEADRLVLAMPAMQGAAYWPREGPNHACLVDIDDLPFEDNSADRMIFMHALEGVSDPQSMLREAWRVLKSGGRMLLFVPNRRGLWAHGDTTPFGHGQPYSASQLHKALRDHGFLVERSWPSLYVPPTRSRLLLSQADRFEKYGEKLFPSFGGLLVIEASKQIYAPILTKTRAFSRPLILPLPAINPVNPLPTGRVPAKI